MKIRFFTFILLFAVQHIFAQIEGTWKGDLSVQGIKLPLVIEIESVENGYKSTLYSPKQSSQGFPTTKFTFENSELFFENELLQAQYKGTLKDGKITGTFTQGGMNMPLILEKSEKTTAQIHSVPNIGNREINTEKLTRYIDYFVKKTSRYRQRFNFPKRKANLSEKFRTKSVTSSELQRKYGLSNRFDNQTFPRYNDYARCRKREIESFGQAFKILS